MATTNVPTEAHNPLQDVTLNPLSWWNWWITPRATKRDNAFYERNARGISLILITTLLVASFAFIPTGVLAGYEMLMVVFFGFLLTVMGAIAMNKIGIAGWMLSSIQLLIAFTTLYTSGYWAPNAVGMMLITPIVTALLVRSYISKSVFVLAVMLIYAVTAYYQQSTGFISIFDPSYSFSTPTGALTFFYILVFMFAGSAGYFLFEFRSQQAELKELVNTLEDRVNARTRDLEVAAEVSKQVAEELDLNKLLANISQRTQHSFDLYHVSVFLFDEATQMLTYESGSGQAGHTMERGYRRFKINQQGLVPQAGKSRKPVLVNDVFANANHMINPLLPDTQSEMALPMVAGDTLIGVLDLQSTVKNNFTEDDVRVFTTLAGQLGIAVQNARSYTVAEEARQQAIEANQIKSQFLANMSHELRTPLNAILNFTAFVADGTLGPVNEEQVETLEESIASGRHLLSLINDVLDITKIEAGLMDLFIQDVDMNEVIGSVASVGKGLVKDKDITLITEIEEGLPVSYGDKRRLRQVFLNMLSNAVKFTPQGKVTIRAKAIEHGVRVEVEDTGIGIAESDQLLVFQSFKQAKHDLQEAIGTGLGMPISKYFVESHQGKMWLTSEHGVGTTFYVELPVLTEEEANAINMSMNEQLA